MELKTQHSITSGWCGRWSSTKGWAEEGSKATASVAAWLVPIGASASTRAAELPRMLTTLALDKRGRRSTQVLDFFPRMSLPCAFPLVLCPSRERELEISRNLEPTLGPIEIENNWTLIENTAAVAWLVPVNGDRNGAPGVQSEGVEDRIEVDLYHLKGPWRTGAGGCLLECVATAADPEPASDDDDLPKRIGRMVLRMIMRARRWSTGCCPQVRPSHCK